MAKARCQKKEHQISGSVYESGTDYMIDLDVASSMYSVHSSPMFKQTGLPLKTKVQKRPVLNYPSILFAYQYTDSLNCMDEALYLLYHQDFLNSGSMSSWTGSVYRTNKICTKFRSGLFLLSCLYCIQLSILQTWF
jgi:hypothetical protein